MSNYKHGRLEFRQNSEGFVSPFDNCADYHVLAQNGCGSRLGQCHWGSWKSTARTPLRERMAGMFLVGCCFALALPSQTRNWHRC